MNESQLFRKIMQLNTQISVYRNALNTESVWLFITILGCWSVTEPYLRTAALVITFIVFAHRVFKALPVKATFDGMINEIKTAISDTALVTEERKRFLLSEVENIEQIELTYKKSLISVPGFILGFVFFGATVIYFILFHA